MNNTVFGKNMEKCEKPQRSSEFHNRKKKKLFRVRTTLSYYKHFTEMLFVKEMDKNIDTYEETCLFRTSNTKIK